MAVTAKVVTGSIAPGGAGTKTAFTSTGFGTPDCAIVFVSDANTTNNPQTPGSISVGFWDGSTNGFCATIQGNFRQTSDNALHFTSGNIDIVKAEATTDGVNLWNVGSTSVARYATVVLLSGVTNSALAYATNVEGGGTISGLGFAPNFVLASCIGSAGSDNTQIIGLLSFGAAAYDGTTITQGCVLYDATNENNYVHTSAICGQYFNGTLNWAEGISSFDAGGFTLGDGSGSGDGIIYLALELPTDGDGHVGIIDTKGATGTQAYTGLGFEPVVVGFCPTGSTATGGDTTSEGFFLGVDDGTNRGAVTIVQENGGGTDESEFTSTYSLYVNSAGTPVTEAAVSSFDADGFTINFATSGTATKALYWAIGDSAATGGGPAAELDGTASASASATGALTTQIPIAGAAVSAATATGAITAAIPLAGASAAVSSAAGDLTAQIRLAGSALAQALAAAGLTTAIPLAGAAAGTAAGTADLTTGGGAAELAGAAQAAATGIADLTIQIRLSGAALAQALATGSLTAPGQGLAGNAQAQAVGAGALTTAIPITGGAVSIASADGSLSTIIPLAGVAASVASAVGSLDLSLALSGAALAQAQAGGSLTATITLSGAAVANATARGAFDASGDYRKPPAERSLLVWPDARRLGVAPDARRLVA